MDVKAYADLFTIVKEREEYALKKYLGPNEGTVKIPEGITRISSGAFQHHDKIRKIIFPRTLKRVHDDMCCWWEQLEEVIIPEGVTAIGRDAFRSTALREITLPSTLERLGTGAFSHCDKLKNIYTNHMSSTLLASFFCSDYETIESKCDRDSHDRELMFKIYLGNQDGMEFSQYFRYYEPRLEGKAKFEIKELFIIYNNHVIGYIGTDVNLQIPDTVIGIGYEAFIGNTKIQSVTMGKKIKQIGYSAFEGCSSLHTVTLNKNIESIGDEAFRYTRIKRITVPLKVQYVGAHAFDDCHYLEQVIVEDDSYGNYKLRKWHRLWDIGLVGKLKFDYHVNY